MIGFLITGLAGEPALAPLGLVIYYFAFGLIGFLYLKKRYDFPFILVFRAFTDTTNFLKMKLKNRK
jgi:hypothetical protein